MASHPLDGAFERINRAGKHLAELKRIFRKLGEIHHESVVIEFDPDPPYEPRPVETLFAYPAPQIGILIGETCYNLRAALDYLIYELARSCGASGDYVQFPLEMTKNKFRERKGRSIGFITNPAHLAAIEAVQPYHGIYWSTALARISNADKHRFIQTTTTVEILRARFTIGETNRFSSIRRAIRPDGVEVEMQLSSAIEVRIPFEAASRGTIEEGPAIDTLHKIKMEVTSLLRAFHPEF